MCNMIKSGVLLFAVCLLLPETVWSSCIEGDCRQGTGVYVAKDGKRYEGPFVSGKAHGTGTLTYPDGTVYKGAFQNGRMTGTGELKGRDGRRYEGEFKDGIIDGQGYL